MLQKSIYLAGSVLALALLGGCSSAYYKTMESFGVEKRDILVDRVEEARDAQDSASEQFASALEQFRAIGALRNELDSIERDTANLIKQMQNAIAEANAFIDSMES